MIKKRREINMLEREFIEIWVRHNISYREMGRRLKRNHTVIMREVKRNSGDYTPYTARGAQRIIKRRKRKKRLSKIDLCLKLKKYILEKMKKDHWSPNDIAGRLKKQGENIFTGYITISHESIYQWIYEGNGKYLGLYKYLHYKQSKRKPHFKRKKQKNNIIKGRISIHDRPGVVDKKKRFGDWESDTMVFSKQKPCISVQYERKSKLVRITKMINRSANETLEAITASVDSISQWLFHTITFDNGLEAANHEKIKDNFNVQTFFCDPYSPWQKGGVENMNKWIRKFLPRSTDLNNISNNDIYIIQEKLNNKPRKSLNYKTPNELLEEELSRFESGAYLT